MNHSPLEDNSTLPPTPMSAAEVPMQAEAASPELAPTGEYGSLGVRDPLATHGFTPSPLAGPLPTIPGYDILGELGRGGMGVVYKARHEKLNRLVALKMVLGSSVASPEARIRFMLEGEVLGRLQHPHIVQIYEVGTFEGQPYFALEYVEGGTLADLLKEKPVISPTEAAGLVETLAHAVHYAHSNGVIHRDLKPANILLSLSRAPEARAELSATDPETSTARASGARLNEFVPKIADFGLAKQTEVGTGLTASGAVMGTPAYMAPEQAEGKIKQICAATDVYALGAILYELLAGRPPFVGNTPMDVIGKVMNEEPPSVTSLRGKLPKDLVTICHKCLQKEPANRYATAEALAADLRCFLDHKPILARPVGAMERLGMWVRRHPSVAALWAVGIVGILGVLLGVVWFQNRELHQQAEQQRQKEELRRATKAEELVNALTTADIVLVPRLISDLKEYRAQAEPLLRQQLATATTEQDKLHLTLALLPWDATQAAGLAQRLLTATPVELLVIRSALHGASFPLAPWWTLLDNPQTDTAQRFRVAGALALAAPDDPRWEQQTSFLASQLTHVSVDSLGTWREVFRPVRLRLLAGLETLWRQPLPTKGTDAVRLAAFQRQQQALLCLADYASDQPMVLVRLLCSVNELQHATLYPALVPHRTAALPLLLAELQIPPLPETAKDEEHDRLAQRQANAAALLLLLDHAEPVWPRFRHSPDPSLRSYLLHRCAAVQVPPELLWQRFLVEKDISAQRALVLALGEYPATALASVGASARRANGADNNARRADAPTLAQLLALYRDYPDAGLHGALAWTLRRWGHAEALAKIDQELATGNIEGQRHWYVNKQGQTFTVIPGSVEFLMGSPDNEPERGSDETQNCRRIPRGFAIATTEVTVAQFKKFQANFGHSEMRRCPTPDCPILGVTWYEAAEYCNWLSKQEGLPEAEWCYQPTAQGDYAEGMNLKPNYLSLKGYRLPTEAEWEYACRAGAVTSRYYGRTPTLLPQYDWYFQTSDERSQPVGSLKPNDLGLFDTLGNLFEWCNDRYPPSPPPRLSTVDLRRLQLSQGLVSLLCGVSPVDKLASLLGQEKVWQRIEEVLHTRSATLIVNNSTHRVLRGGAWYYHKNYCRCAVRYWYAPSDRYFTIGFRVIHSSRTP